MSSSFFARVPFARSFPLANMNHHVLRNEPAPFKSPSPYTLLFFTILGIAAISFASIFIRLANAPPIAIATYRVTLAALLVTPYFALSLKRAKRSWSSKAIKVTFISGVFLALHFIFWITSLTLTSVASSTSLVSTTPLFVALFSYWFMDERPSRRLQWGIFFAVLGSTLLAGSDYSFSHLALAGDSLAILGAIMGTGYLIAGRFARKELDLPAYTLGAYGAAALVLLATSLITQTPLYGFTQETYFFLVLIALVPQLIGHTSFNWALKFLSPTRVAALILGEPIGSTILAYLLLGETLSLNKSIGLSILGVGILMSSLGASHSQSCHS